MGERAAGLSSVITPNGTYTNGASPREDARRLEGEIAALREELGGLVAELDRRRHELTDVKLQVRRHALEVTITAVTLVGAAAGLVWLGVWRARRQRTLLSRADRVRGAVLRMIDQRPRALAEPSVHRKIFTAAATGAVATLMRKVVDRGLRGALERRRRRPSSPAPKRRWWRSAAA
jgi:hypothetical protein